jgi:hypothetical protein
MNGETHVDALAIDLVVKLLRAHGGCLGARRRRRTWLAAISFGEPQAGVDPEISEWGNPAGVISCHLPAEYIGWSKRTRGIETSKYPQEKKSNEIPSVVASERGTAQTDWFSGRGCRASDMGFRESSRTAWKSGPQQVIAL